jgi:hypothetical protein
MNDSGQPQIPFPLTRGKSPRCRLHRRLDWPQPVWAFCSREKLLTLLESETRLFSPWPPFVPTTLPLRHAGSVNWQLSQGTIQRKGTSQVAIGGYVISTFVGRLESNFVSSYLRAQLGQSRVWQRFGLDETLSRDVADFKMAASKGIDCKLVLDIRFKFSVC